VAWESCPITAEDAGPVASRMGGFLKVFPSLSVLDAASLNNNKEKNMTVSLVIDQNDSYEMTRSKLYKALVDSNFDKFLASEMLCLKIYETQRLMSEYQIKRPYTLA
jgi:hypothetical protein